MVSNRIRRHYQALGFRASIHFFPFFFSFSCMCSALQNQLHLFRIVHNGIIFLLPLVVRRVVFAEILAELLR